MQQNCKVLSLGELASLLGVSKSGYYHWLQRPKVTVKNSSARIQAQFKLHNGKAGAPMLSADLKAEGLKISERTIGREMHKLGLRAQCSAKYRHHKEQANPLSALPNELQRCFKVLRPNQVWVTDITYIRTTDGWVYLCNVIDMFSRKVVGWKTSHYIDKNLACEALQDAFTRRGNPKGVLVHSDQGSQFNSKGYRALVLANGARQSMSRRGNCWDNAVAESWFATLKKSVIHGQRKMSAPQLQSTLFEYIEIYYNRFRRHSTNGWVSPSNYELQYKQQFTEGLDV
jgi:transposase InsO family protein